MNRQKQRRGDELTETKKTYQESIRCFCNAIQNPGTFSVGGSAQGKLPSIPGLRIDTVEEDVIPFPITPHYAAFLQSEAQQAPFGKGYDTVIDTSVRNGWEIDGDRIWFENEDWEPAIECLAREVVEGLGSNPKNLGVDLYKLLLYSKDGHFKRHKDTEKVDNMFATLVVQLPSCFTGGSFETYHRGKTISYDMGTEDQSCRFQCYYTAHYADIDHQLNPITSGNRVALVYSLYWKQDGMGQWNTAQQATKQGQKLCKILSNWTLQEEVMPSYFGYLFDHEYTEASITSLGFKCLKGRDKEVTRAFQMANNQVEEDEQVSLYILEISKHCNYVGGGGYRGEYDWEVTEEDISYCNLYDESGDSASVCHDHDDDYSLTDFVNASDHDLEDDDDWEKLEENIDLYTGNAGPTKTTTYRRYALLIYPRKCESD